MSWRNRPYWFKGGVIAVPVYLVVAPLSFFLAVKLGGGQGLIWYIGPEFFLGAWAFVGGPGYVSAHLLNIAVTLVELIGIFVLRVYLMGAVLGAVYGWFAKRGWRTIFFILLIVLYALGMWYISFSTQSTWEVYSSAASPADCSKSSSKFVNNFDTNECYMRLAIAQQDTKLCDYIDTSIVTGKSGEDYKAFCYEEVAHTKNDSSVCAQIPDLTYNDHGASENRRDGCYQWFGICERMTDVVNRDLCWSGLARSREDPSLCSKVSNTNKYYSSDRCLEDLK